MQKMDVELKKVDLDTGSDFSDLFYRNCSFCEKLVKITPANFHSCANIGNNEYCPFCLRHNFHYRNNHNVLIFSFRSIVGYYYHRFYKVKPHKIFVSEIKNFIEKNIEIGINNPTLSYEPNSLLWFADFNKIGADKHKAPYNEILETIKSMYDVFNIESNISMHADTTLWKRFEDAFEIFYKQRKRPKDKRKLIPTFSQITPAHDTEEFHEQTRNFVLSHLIVK